MNSTGRLLRIFGAAILLIAVQFAPVAAEAHVGHSHGPDGHGLQAQGIQTQAPGDAAVAAETLTSGQTGPVSRIATPEDRAQAAAQAVTAVQNARGAAAGPNICVTSCCGTGMGCCGAALVAASPSLLPRASPPRVGFAHLISLREADLRGLRRPPRLLA